MKTDDLISALSTDAGKQRVEPGLVLLLAVAASAVLAGTLLMGSIGPRADFATATGSIRFLFKFVVTLTIAASAFVLVHRSLYPEMSRRLPWMVLLAGPLLLLVGIVAELTVLPADAWSMSATGKNGLFCLTVIPLLGIGPLAILIWALRRGAPTRPGLAGLCAGLLAGGIAATFYAANCTDNSPLFVATWYPIAIGALALLGSALGRYFARW